MRSGKTRHFIRPGYVDTEMGQGENMFWVSPPQKAAQQIISAIKSKKSCAYITRRWYVIAWILKILPSSIYKRFF